MFQRQINFNFEYDWNLKDDSTEDVAIPILKISPKNTGFLSYQSESKVFG